MDLPKPSKNNSGAEAITPSIEPGVKNIKPFFKKKWLITTVLLLAIIPLLTGVLSIKKVTVPKKPGTTLIATIDNQPVYLTDIQKVALEQYQPDAVDEDALRISYDILTERLILDKAAKDLNIDVSAQEINEALSRSTQPGDKILPIQRTNTRYQLLKNKILRREVESREAYSIGFYIASYDEQQGDDVTDDERTLFEQQREDGAKALVEMDQRLKEGEIPLTLARDIYNKYPSLQSILAVNGYILKSTANETLMATPKLYDYEQENVGQPFFDAIYTMKLNEIKAVNEDNGSGGYVIYMKTINHANIRTYQDWLAQKKKELVKQNVSL